LFSNISTTIWFHWAGGGAPIHGLDASTLAPAVGVVVGATVGAGGSGVVVGVAVGRLVCVGLAVGSGKVTPHAEENRTKIIARFTSKSFFIQGSILEGLIVVIMALHKEEWLYRISQDLCGDSKKAAKCPIHRSRIVSAKNEAKMK
jgi:hypothetical protein